MISILIDWLDCQILQNKNQTKITGPKSLFDWVTKTNMKTILQIYKSITQAKNLKNTQQYLHFVPKNKSAIVCRIFLAHDKSKVISVMYYEIFQKLMFKK